MFAIRTDGLCRDPGPPPAQEFLAYGDAEDTRGYFLSRVAGKKGQTAMLINLTHERFRQVEGIGS